LKILRAVGVYVHVSLWDRNLEKYQESAWSSMSELEQQLKQLEMNVAQQFGEVDTSDGDSVDDCADDCDSERKCDGGDSDFEEEDFIPDDSLYCIACKKSFKSDKALVYDAQLFLLYSGL